MIIWLILFTKCSCKSFFVGFWQLRVFHNRLSVTIRITDGQVLIGRRTLTWSSSSRDWWFVIISECKFIIMGKSYCLQQPLFTVFWFTLPIRHKTSCCNSHNLWKNLYVFHYNYFKRSIFEGISYEFLINKWKLSFTISF